MELSVREWQMLIFFTAFGFLVSITLIQSWRGPRVTRHDRNDKGPWD